MKLFLSNQAYSITFRGSRFHNRVPLNFIESMQNIMPVAAGICSKSLVLRSYLMFFLVKYSCMKGGLIFLSALYISIMLNVKTSDQVCFLLT